MMVYDPRGSDTELPVHVLFYIHGRETCFFRRAHPDQPFIRIKQQMYMLGFPYSFPGGTIEREGFILLNRDCSFFRPTRSLRFVQFERHDLLLFGYVYSISYCLTGRFSSGAVPSTSSERRQNPV